MISSDAVLAFFKDGTPSDKILVLWRRPSLSYLAAIHEAFLAFRSHG
jgi:hypothetical protein